MRKLSKAEILVQERMLSMLKWASDRPNKWHNIGKLDVDSKAAKLLEKRGVIETRQPWNQYRLKQPSRPTN